MWFRRGADVNVGRADAISVALGAEAVGVWHLRESGRAAGAGEHALVLRRTRAACAAQHERY